MTIRRLLSMAALLGISACSAALAPPDATHFVSEPIRLPKWSLAGSACDYLIERCSNRSGDDAVHDVYDALLAAGLAENAVYGQPQAGGFVVMTRVECIDDAGERIGTNEAACNDKAHWDILTRLASGFYPVSARLRFFAFVGGTNKQRPESTGTAGLKAAKLEFERVARGRFARDGWTGARTPLAFIDFYVFEYETKAVGYEAAELVEGGSLSILNHLKGANFKVRERLASRFPVPGFVASRVTRGGDNDK